MDNILRIGLVGTGMIGRSHIERINTRLQGAKVVAVSDSAAEFAKKVAQERGCEFFADGEEMIASDSVNAVIVTTIDEYHEQYVMASINAGKYVFVEKPLAFDLAGAKRILDAEIALGKKLVQVGFMRRYDKGYLQLKDYVENKKLGEPLMIHCCHRNPDVPDYYDTPMAVENTMIHEADVLRWLLGENFVSAEVVFPRKTKHASEKLQDPQIMYLTTESGVRIDVEAWVTAQYGYDIRCEVCCEDGTISLPDPNHAPIRANAANSTPLCTSWTQRFPEAYDTELQMWINATKEDRVDGPTSWDGYAAQLITSAASKARDSGTVVEIKMEETPPLFS